MTRTRFSTTTAGTNAKTAKRDDVFYLNLITFEVEGILFRLPRSPFEADSEVFRDMFALPSTGGEVDGSSDEKPLILHGIEATDFRAFLKALLSPAYGTQSELNQTEWISVLRLARLWNFQMLLEASVEALNDLSVEPALKIMLAKKYHVTEWLRPNYYALIMQLEPLTAGDTDVLGTDCVLKLAQIREFRYKWIIGHKAPKPKPPGDPQIAPPPSPEPSAWGVALQRSASVSASAIGLDPDLFWDVKQKYAVELEHAVHDAISNTFNLDADA